MNASFLVLTPLLLLAPGCPYISADQSEQALDPDGDGAPWYEVYEEWGVAFEGPEGCVVVEGATPDFGSTFTLDLYLKAGVAGEQAGDMFPLVVIPGSFALIESAGRVLAGPGDLEALGALESPGRGFMDGAFHHLAVSLGMSGYLSLYLDGSLLSHQQVVLPEAEESALYLGCWPEHEASFVGTLGELRIVDAAIYGGDFDPAWEPYGDDANVQALLHFDEGMGSTTSSESGDFVGVLDGVVWSHFDLACLDESLDCGPNPVEHADDDRDGFGADEDCDDGDAHVHPGAGEACDGVDNDCDGLMDEADPESDCGEDEE